MSALAVRQYALSRGIVMHMQPFRPRAFALFRRARHPRLLRQRLNADPPSRAARLGYAAGAVSFSPAGENEWALATPNRPLITGDRLWADAGGRAEMQVGGAIRLGAGTSL